MTHSAVIVSRYVSMSQFTENACSILREPSTHNSTNNASERILYCITTDSHNT